MSDHKLREAREFYLCNWYEYDTIIEIDEDTKDQHLGYIHVIEKALYKLCHYTNLQPLWALDNIKKGPAGTGPDNLDL